MLETAHEIIRRVGKRLNLSDTDIEYLIKANAEHEFEIALRSGKRHKAYRIQHNNTLGPYKGGIRFHPEVDRDEVYALATLMSLKTAAIGLPLGGGKGGVVVNPKELSTEELEELSRKYAAHLSPHIGPDKDIPAPDVNTNATIMDWMVDEFEKQTGDTSKASFTGKSVAKGGSLGRDAATGRGGVMALREVLKLMGRASDVFRIAVQGFGNVGAYFAQIAEAEQSNWKITAASDSSGGLHAEAGLKIADLAQHKKQGGRLYELDADGATPIDPDKIITQDVEVLVLAALGDAITETNMKRVQASIILELANGPINEAAYSYLTKKGVLIVPDVLANAGGVIVSYLEWLQNKQGEKWEESRVNQELERYMVRAIDEAYNFGEREGLTLKEAAITLAVKRILAARNKA